jgi:hypothetical protein
VIKFLLASLNSLERQGLRPHAVLIENAANGPAVCQLLRRQVPGLIAVRPKGSKASRAHAVATPARPRRHRSVNPLAAANALALQHQVIAERVAANIARRTGHPRRICIRSECSASCRLTRRYSPERGSFRPYARTYANGEVYHYLRDKGFLIKVPASWRELHARGQKLLRLGTAAAEVPERLGVSVERWREIGVACGQRVVAMEAVEQD